jgi:hypothetical protein
MDERAVVFEYRNTETSTATLCIHLEIFQTRTPWAVPEKKERHDWGEPVFRWDAAQRLLAQSYSSPLDATHSPTVGLWLGELGPAWKGIKVRYQEEPGKEIRFEVVLPPGQPLRFGVNCADSDTGLTLNSNRLRQEAVQLSTLQGAWSAWLSNSKKRIQEKLGVDVASLQPGERKVIEDNLLQTRLLFLSNGGILTEPITSTSFSVSVRAQAVAVNHWRAMGLDFPFAERWRGLARYNQSSERSIPIPLFSSGGLIEVLGQGKMIVTSPDPNSPPDKTSFDSLLGYVVAGGAVTLVDGVWGFQDKAGWWRDAGAVDLADYALRTLGAGLDPQSRRVLDGGSLAGGLNTALQGAALLGQGSLGAASKVDIQLPQPQGYLILGPSSAGSRRGMRLHSVRFGSSVTLPYTSQEAAWIAGGYGRVPTRDAFGKINGCQLTGEGYTAYRVPEAATAGCVVEVEGDWVAGWSKEPPVQDVILRKKVVMNWYNRELLSVPIPRMAHPVVYSGTYTARVFDVSGTEESPVWFFKAGRGSLAWLGLPRDFVLYGSDCGTDAQNSLRNDPTYDLLRYLLALQDPKGGGSAKVSVTPLAGWTEAWNQSDDLGPRPDLAYFAWQPFDLLGTGGGGLRTWAQEAILDALKIPASQGEALPSSPLLVRRSEEGKGLVDLPTHAFTFALYKSLDRLGGKAERTWLQSHAAREAARLEQALARVLNTTGETPLAARWILNGTLAGEAPLESILPEAAWAVSEIDPEDFPGGIAARNRLLSKLAADGTVTSYPQATAALAACVAERREEFLGRLMQGLEGLDLSLIGNKERSFDLAVAIPAIHALCLARGKELRP